MYNFIYRLLLACSLLFLVSCHEDEEEQPEEMGTARRTVVMYVSAQNSLGHLKFHEGDSIEISRGYKSISDDDRLLVYVDDNHAPRLYQYTANSPQPKVIRQWKTDLNSSDPATLQEVLTLVKDKFPASEYGLVMWSHSNGWVPSTNNPVERKSAVRPFSFGIDVGPGGSMAYDEDKKGQLGAQMEITDMALAIKKSGIHFNFIFFDSCLMQNLEVGYTLREVTDFIIGAPMQIPACGADYTHLLKKGLFTDAARDIVDVYTQDATAGFSDWNSPYYDFGLVISSIRTDKLDQLAHVMAAALPRSSVMERQSADLSKVLFYQAYSSTYFYCPHNYDAQQAMQTVLSPADYPAFEQALEEVVVNKGATEKFWIGPGNSNMQKVDLDNFCGLSIFIPQNQYTYNAAATPLGDLNKAFQHTSWYQAAGWAITGW